MFTNEKYRLGRLRSSNLLSLVHVLLILVILYSTAKLSAFLYGSILSYYVLHMKNVLRNVAINVKELNKNKYFRIPETHQTNS